MVLSIHIKKNTKQKTEFQPLAADDFPLDCWKLNWLDQQFSIDGDSDISCWQPYILYLTSYIALLWNQNTCNKWYLLSFKVGNSKTSLCCQSATLTGASFRTPDMTLHRVTYTATADQSCFATPTSHCLSLSNAVLKSLVRPHDILVSETQAAEALQVTCGPSYRHLLSPPWASYVFLLYDSMRFFMSFNLL